MANSATLDLDEQALVKRPRPVGWYVAALLALAALGFALGFHLPLKSAHRALVTAHEALAKKSGELDAALKSARAELATTSSARDGLRARTDALDKQAHAEEDAYRTAAATLESQQAVWTKAGWLKAKPQAHALGVVLAPGKTFVGATAKLAPAVAKPLCSATASVALPNDWALRLSVRVEDPKVAKDWQLGSERAAALAEALVSRCKLDPSRLWIGAAPAPAESEVSLVMTRQAP